MKRSSLPVLLLLGALVAVAFASPARATFNACASAKNKCVSKKTAGLLKCHQLAEKKGLPVSDQSIQTCLQKVVAKFDGGATPSKGCFAKLEAKYPGGCLTTTDTAALENTVDDFVDAVVSALDPGYPAPVTNACSVGKKQCVSKKATALLACHSKNEKPPAGLAPEKFAACLQKAQDQFDGGATPSKGCFTKLETKYPDCLTTLDTAALETTVDGFVNDVVCQLDAGSDVCPSRCVYVSTGQGDDTNGTGSRQSPLKTIAVAIQKAQATAVPSVCLSGEVYNETVTMVSGISVYGGFDQNSAGLKFRRSPNVTTTVTAPGVVFDAPQIDQETHIEGITINATAVAVVGASVYGVRLGGGAGQLFVRDNIIQAAAGSDGDPGMDGAANGSAQAPAGNDGQSGCSNCSGNGGGGPQPACTEYGGKGGDAGYNNGNGQSGSPGSGGAMGGTPGMATGACFAPSGKGGDGSLGANGSQGQPGSGGAALGTASASDYVPADGGTGTVGTNGKGGGGGGGGGGGSCELGGFCTCNADRGGGGGSGGCGGLAGEGGLGGGGGGGSFGVFAAAGTVTVAGNDITTHDGGKGGKGGNGAAGQSPGAGGTGGAGADDAGGGGDGKPGGSGGAGGPGGGGGGGPSACLGRAASVVFSFDTNTCTTGVPGLGGNGGTNPMGGVASPGQAGTTSPNLEID